MKIESIYLFTEFPKKADGSTNVGFLKKAVVTNKESKVNGTNTLEKSFLEEFYDQVA